ncbi:hypothetical protein NDX98_08590 [Enterobacter roggenkampii]
MSPSQLTMLIGVRRSAQQALHTLIFIAFVSTGIQIFNLLNKDSDNGNFSNGVRGKEADIILKDGTQSITAAPREN